ncbi:MAG TPA: hypothetical protein VFB12_30570 [Ktedonobacteraceae bacterium]|nr:hypothetical protein [Ktedonobacteraceae bacterium]
MQKKIQTFFSEETLSDEEFDNLCCDLLQVTPPTTLVEQIMAAIEQLHPQILSIELLEPCSGSR